MAVQIPIDDPALAEFGSIRDAYQAYFADGHYEERYPQPNRLTLARLIRMIDGAESPPFVLDYGCGSGRYLIPLLERTPARFMAYDISEEAQERLRVRLMARGGLGRVEIVEESGLGDAGFEGRMASAQLDLAMMIFGVIAHVGNRADRLALLRSVRQALKPDGGQLILSVPNRRRRFPLRNIRSDGPADEPSASSHDIRYTRRLGGKDIRLHYHLYDVADLRQELSEAGFAVLRVQAESLLPESWITRRPWLGRMDAFFASWLPASLGYGILAIAAPKEGQG